MAILSKIRERSMFLIIIIGLALFAFVLDPSTLGDFFSSSKINQVGEINGETISRQEFAEALENYQSQTGNSVSEMQASKTVWENMVREKIYTTQLEEAGITIGEQDIMNNLYQATAVQSDPRFQSGGIFDKEKFLGYLASIKDDPKQKQTWGAWQNYIKSIGDNLKRTTYDDLIGAGLGASLKEGEMQYFDENTKVSGKYVYVPFNTIPDSLITIKKSEVQNYIDKHASDFKTDATRDVNYVKFDIKATKADEEALKAEVGKLIEDSKDRYDQPVLGLKNTTDYVAFLEENKSDTPLDNNFKVKNNLFAEISEDLISKNVGEVFGPYKDRGFYKISKVTEVTQMPDSVKASHILIPFVGSRAAGPQTTKTEEQARKSIDSLYRIVKRSKSKFIEAADEINQDGTKGKGGDIGWVTNNVAFTPNFDVDFANFMFNNKKGSIEVVKTKFGFHIIKIEDSKNKQKAVKLATLSRKIVASEDTENNVFQDAEKFALEIANGKDFYAIAKEKEMQSRPAVALKALDENVPGLGNQRQIVSWAHGKDANVGDYRRFDIENGYVVAIITNKVNKGLLPVNKATGRVRPFIINKKKAALIEAKMKGASLGDIATAAKQSVKNLSEVTLNAPTISGVGSEPKVIGAMLNAKENELYNNVIGDKGVFAFTVTKKELPTALPNYDTYRKRIADQRRSMSFKMFEAIKKAAKISDDRTTYYGVE